jgi:hypothetical protein
MRCRPRQLCVRNPELLLLMLLFSTHCYAPHSKNNRCGVFNYFGRNPDLQQVTVIATREILVPSTMCAAFGEGTMNWTRFVAIIIGAGVASSLTDWLFAGDWLHRRYTYPEIWRQGAEGRAIALSSPLPFLTCGVFAYVTAWLDLHSVASTVKLAVAVWLIGPLPLILTNAAFMKLHRVFVASYAIGWLVKLMIIAVALGWFVH